MTKNVTSLVLDRAATVEGGNPIIRSSAMSWVDTDGDHRISKKETLGKYSVLEEEKMGNGEILVLSDPSIFINVMNSLDPRWNNNIFIGNLVKEYTPLLIDQSNSRTVDSIGVSWGVHMLRSTPALKVLLTGGVILLLWLILIRKRKLGVDSNDR